MDETLTKCLFLLLRNVWISFRCSEPGLQAKGAQKQASNDKKRGEWHGRLAEDHLHYEPGTDSLGLLTHALGAVESWIREKPLIFRGSKALTSWTNRLDSRSPPATGKSERTESWVRFQEEGGRYKKGNENVFCQS